MKLNNTFYRVATINRIEVTNYQHYVYSSLLIWIYIELKLEKFLGTPLTLIPYQGIMVVYFVFVYNLMLYITAIMHCSTMINKCVSTPTPILNQCIIVLNFNQGQANRFIRNTNK